MNRESIKLIVATNNQGKIRELALLLADVPVTLKTLGNFSDIVEVEETGSTFTENAILKARGYALQTGQMALADDSGLEVNALNGAPGVFSARYGGEHIGFDKKMLRILSEMADLPGQDRSAQFVCVMAIADAAGEILCTAEGSCKGKIAFKPRGLGGFGYDPIFEPEGHEMTFGELPDLIKQEISHRARASAIINRFLRDFIAV
ncbi:MAG: RdgB/HAM1 family non-canonical purine NTP pyrophosphatase [Saprospiraceae bacterium]|nr:RdgB/HAM1 family non-canonical purine NTP pyrophosphatase [Pyrinomonadaceae bacterium]